MKICSLYGAGFYYIPGTDTCLKLGGFVRNESGYNSSGSFATWINGANAQYDNGTEAWISRTRVALSIDTRSQTQYGTLRSYLRGGWQWTTGDNITSNNNVTYFDRGFIQIAGFTTGQTASFYDFHSHATYSFQTQALAQEAGGSGTNVFAYTGSFGNGLSATVSLEDSSYRRAPVVDLSNATVGTFNTSDTSDAVGSKAPDIVGNIRIDQAWGSAQVQGAGHLVGGRSFGTTIARPSDTWGSAFGAGAMFNLPMLAKGDSISVGANWCNGALRYCSNPATAAGSGLIFGIRDGGTIAIGNGADGYFGAAGTSIQLSRAWSISAGFQHFWVPSLRTSLYGQYLNYKANSSLFDAAICTGAANRGSLTSGCGDFSGYQIGTRTLWNPVANLDVGVDFMYTRAKTAYAGGVQSLTPAGQSATTHTAGDVGVYSAFFRVQRNFWP